MYDAPSLASSLFDVQGWQDFSDASFASLLQALLNSQLGLRLAPWQVIAANPIARPRLSLPWPLPGSLAQMRWRPGDGVRLLARDVRIQDATPRQIMLITRQIHPNGSTGAQVGFAAGPAQTNYSQYSPARVRTPAKTLKQQLYALGRWQRNYQKQLVTLTGTYVNPGGVSVGAGNDGPATIVMLLSSDLLVRTRLRVVTAGASFNVKVNGSDFTTALNGPWTTVPMDLDLGPVAVSANALWVSVHNNSGLAATFEYQLFVDVLR